MTFKKLQICEIQARAPNNWECCFKCTINANGLHLSVRLWRVTDFFLNVQLYAVSKIYILSPRDKCRLKVEIALKSILFFLNTWKWGLQRWYRVKTDIIANNNKRKRRIKSKISNCAHRCEVPLSRNCSSSKTKTLSPVNNNSPFRLPPAPGNHHSTCFFCEYDYLTYLV